MMNEFFSFSWLYIPERHLVSSMKALIFSINASQLTYQNFNATLYFLGSFILSLW
jgi:hypothetical protein